MNRTNNEQHPTLPQRHATAAVFAWATLLIVAGLGMGCSTARDPLPDITAPPSMETVRLPEAGSDPYMQQVRQLAHPDFEVRTRAAGELVAAGDAALPALGRAGDLEVPVAGGLKVSATRSVVQSIVEQAGDERLDEHLGSPWANVRRAAAAEIGGRDQWASIPRLIERLDDRDAEVRAASAASLRRLTNQWFGYRAMAAVGTRRSAADRWRRWWTLEGRAQRAGPGPQMPLADARQGR